MFYMQGSWGRCIGLMINECKRVKLLEPEFNTNGTSYKVYFGIPTKLVTKLVTKFNHIYSLLVKKTESVN